MQGLRAFGDRELQAAVPRLMLAIPSSVAAVESFVPAGSIAERNRVRACIRWCARTYARARPAAPIAARLGGLRLTRCLRCAVGMHVASETGLRAAVIVSWSETVAASGCVLLLVTLFGRLFRPSVAAKTCATSLSTAEHQRPCTSHRSVAKAVHILVATLALSGAVMALAELPAQPTAKAAVVPQPSIAGRFTDGASAALRAHLSVTAAEDRAAQPSLAAGTSAHARNRMHAHASPISALQPKLSSQAPCLSRVAGAFLQQ